jgi:hypothetical protein
VALARRLWRVATYSVDVDAAAADELLARFPAYSLAREMMRARRTPEKPFARAD